MSETFSEHSSSGIGLPSFSKKTKIIAAISIVLLFAGGVVAQTAGTKAVSLGSNGIDINLGELDMNGNDVVSGATTVWDASAGEIPNGVLPSPLDADTLSGNNVSEIRSGTTSSDVGLGNVENEAAVAESGDSMTGDLNLNTNSLITTGGITTDSAGSFDTNEGNIRFFEANAKDVVSIEAQGYVELSSDLNSQEGGPYSCELDATTGNWNCDGTKNWVHSLNETHEAVYTSQESPEVRAVYEGQTTVNDGTVSVELPSHFEKTVSDTRPSLRVQVTPHELATVAVTERSDSSLTIEASKDVNVDYRVTGIREGYEDKQVVREKE